MSVVFSRASGVSCVSRSFCSCLLGVGGGLRGVPGFGVRCARAACFSSWGAGRWLASFSWGAGWGVRLRAPGCSPGCLVLAVVGVGGRGRGCACCPVPVVGVGLCPVSSAACCGGGFRVLFFSVRCFSCLLVLRCLVLCWVVVSAGSGGCGGCRVGFGVVFSPASVVLARACLGLGWVLFGEFDPGSGRTLAACLTHASRTGPLSFLGVG